MVKWISLAGIYTFIASRFNAHDLKNNTEIHLQAQKSSLFYSFKYTLLEGKMVSFDQFKGKKVVIINTASKCGYTPQFSDWQEFHEKYGDKIVVLGFPCNQFLHQDPGSNDEIQNFCQRNYGVTFLMFEKVDVKGKDQSPLYRWLTNKSQNGWNDKVPSWNFCKYVVNEEGQLTHFFASAITPKDSLFLEAVGLNN